jgi:cephalosporin-C deacetylase-like acetyl esterase
VQMVLNYLAARGDFDMSRVGMFGQGSGGSIAVLAAAADPRIKALDLLDPWGDWPDWLKYSPEITEAERANYLTPEFLGKVAKLDPVSYLPQLTSQHVRIGYILDDGVVPRLPRDAMLGAAPKSADVVRYRNTADHVNAFHTDGLSGWIRAQLQPGPSQTPAQSKLDSAADGVASSRP